MRTTTWNAIGTDVANATTIDEILHDAGLDYTVEKRAISLPNGFIVPDKMATVKISDDSSEKYIGVVGTNYEVYQNRDAFDFISDIPDLKIVKAGETHTGLVYMIGKLPDVTVLDDTFTPYVIFQTSHNGRYNVRATICPLRIVCQNQFSMSFNNMENSFNIQHSRVMLGKIESAIKLIRETAIYMNGFTNTAEELALLKLSDTSRYSICDAFFKSSKELSERQEKTLAEQKAFFEKCYNADDNANFRGTAWGVLNALSDYETHRQRKQTKTSNDSAFMNVTFDNSAMQKMMSLIRQAA